MNFDPYDYKKIEREEFYENEMQRYKEFAVRAISRIAHFELESITRVLAYSFIEENEDAKKLAYKLNLSKLDFLAVIEDYEEFKELYLREQELAQNF